MYEIIENLFFIIKDIVSSLGYLGVSGAMLLESMCLPIPSELILPLAGFMVADGSITLPLANIAVAIGSMIGSIIAYTVGYYGGRPFILKYGKYFFISEEHFDKADKTFNRFGAAAVFFGRLLPVVRTFISLPAGIARMDFRKFFIFSLMGMLPWNFILIFLGFKFGQQYEVIVRPIFKRFENVGLLAILLIIVFFAIRAVSRHLKKRKAGNF
jgi:membrane protein DedA with SNARE-associated domain